MQTTEAVMERPSSANTIRSVRMLRALYVKDLRELAGICLSLIMLTTLCWGLVLLTEIRLFGIPYSAVTFMFPAVLSYQLYKNHQSGSVYLQQSLPVSPGLTLFSQYIALITYTVLFQSIISVINAFATVYYFTQYAYTLPSEFLARIDLSTQAHIHRFFTELIRSNKLFLGSSAIHYYSGIVCLAASIMHSGASRSRVWYWIGFTGVIILMLVVFALFDRFELQWYRLFGQFSYVLVGILFASFGALLYNRFGEV